MTVQLQKENCFTFLRYLFAFCIFCNHFSVTTDSEPFMCNSAIFVNGFFIISGFLTFNSFFNTPDVKTFALKRVRRILPAYLIVVIMGFFIGLALTSLSISEFLSKVETWRYLVANIFFLNNFQPTLPGVFEDNTLPFVNSSLWTMKIEIAFYVSVPVVYALMKKFGKNKILVFVVLSSVAYNILTKELYEYTHKEIYNMLNHQIPGELCYFYAPVLILANIEKVNKMACWLILVSVVLLGFSFVVYKFYYASPLFLSVIIVYFAYKAEPWIKAYRWQDISYEFYLLHFPLLQTLLFAGFTDSLVVTFFIGLVATVLGAVALHMVCRQISMALPPRQA